MAELNRNNFLRWSGTLSDSDFTCTAVNDSVAMPYGGFVKEIHPLINDFATLGIDPFSLQILTQDNYSMPAVYNPFSQQIDYFPPAGAEVGTRFLTYRWADNLGHYSNIATISIAIMARATEWRVYEPSAYCVTDGTGAFTGELAYSQLQEYYTDTGTPVDPLSTKTNDPSSDDYIAPTTDTTYCPLDSLPVRMTFTVAFANPEVVSPDFFLEHYELKDHTSGDMLREKMLSLFPNSFTTDRCATHNYDFRVQLHGNPGTACVVHVTVDGTPLPDQTFIIGTFSYDFLNITPTSTIEVLISET